MQDLLCTVSHASHIESKTLRFIASHDAYRTFVIAHMTSPFFFFLAINKETTVTNCKQLHAKKKRQKSLIIESI